MPDTQAPTPTPTPTGLTCINCNYDLSTLPTANPCPECGTPIQRSITGANLLRFATPETHRTTDRATSSLRLALHVAATTLITVLCAMLAFILVGFFLDLANVPIIVDHAESIGYLLGSVVGIAFLTAAIAYVYGVWLLTSSPLQLLIKGPWRAPLVRWSLVLFIPLAPLAMLSASTATTTTELVIARASGLLATLCLFTHYTTIREVMISLARRCSPRPTIRRAGPFALLGALILLASEFGWGWAAPYVPYIVIFVFVSLESSIRPLRTAVRAELAAAPTQPPAISST